jgi:hypothetical protein
MTYLDPFESCDWETRCALWQTAKNPHARYYPQPYQERFHREMTWRIKPTSGGIGAAKTMTIGMDYAHEALVAPLRKAMGYGGADGYSGRIAITGLNYDQPRTAFNYLYQVWDAAGLILGKASRPKEGQWHMETKTGVEVLTISSDKPEAFAARPYTVVHMCEAAQQPETMLHAAIERTSRWPGPFVGRIYPEGTFEEVGMNVWYPERCKLWDHPNEDNAKFFRFRSWDNLYNVPRGWDDDKIQSGLKYYQGMGREDLFYVRYGGEIPANPGELWGTVFVKGRHVPDDPIPYDPALPVEIAVDPGTHRYAVLFMQWPNEKTCNVFDELVIRNCDYYHMRDEMLKLPWFDKIKYGVIDVAATQRSQGNESTHSHWAAPRDALHKGMGITLAYEYLSKADGIDVLKTALRGEHYDLRISSKCTELLYDIQNEKLDKHGELNDYINKGMDDCRKALSYYLRCRKGFVPVKRERRPGGMSISNIPGRVLVTPAGIVRA